VGRSRCWSSGTPDGGRDAWRGNEGGVRGLTPGSGPIAPCGRRPSAPLTPGRCEGGPR
jgi:hypothetical protein